FVINIAALKTKELEELMFVTSVISQLEQVVTVYLLPQLFASALDVITQFLVVHTQTASVVHIKGISVSAIQLLTEKTIQLLDCSFVQTFLLHHFVYQSDVERHDRDCSRSLGDDGLQHSHVGITLIFFTQLRIQCRG